VAGLAAPYNPPVLLWPQWTWRRGERTAGGEREFGLCWLVGPCPRKPLAFRESQIAGSLLRSLPALLEIKKEKEKENCIPFSSKKNCIPSTSRII